MVVTGFFVLCEQKRDYRLSDTSTVQNVIFKTKVTTLNKDRWLQCETVHFQG